MITVAYTVEVLVTKNSLSQDRKSIRNTPAILSAFLSLFLTQKDVKGFYNKKI